MATGPLCAFDHCPGDKMETTGGEHRAGDQDGCGTCSAFDACHVCAVHVLPEHVVRFTLSPTLASFGAPEPSWPEIQTGSIRTFSGTAWRPPAV